MKYNRLSDRLIVALLGRAHELARPIHAGPTGFPLACGGALQLVAWLVRTRSFSSGPPLHLELVLQVASI